MRLAQSQANNKVMPENTIPLINIVFLMLIFFLIAGTVAPPISKQLTPPSSEQLPMSPPAANALEILQDGSLVHHGETVSLEAMLARFPAPKATPDAAQAEPTLRVLADKNLPASKLMPVLQALRAAGHKTIRLVTVRGGA